MIYRNSSDCGSGSYSGYYFYLFKMVVRLRSFSTVFWAMCIVVVVEIPLIGAAFAEKISDLHVQPVADVDVTDFGARPDGTGDSAPAFVRAARTLELDVGGRILVPPGTYNFETTFNIPKFTNHAVVEFYMVGATLKTDNSITIFSRLPSDQAEATKMIGAVFLITGGRFVGSGRDGQKGIELAATYSSIIRATQFQALDVGFDGYFNLGLRLENVRTTLNRTVDLRIQSGWKKWPNATKFNSASNHNTFEGVRVFGAEGAFANIAVLGASGVSIRNSIVEGKNPVNAIYFDNQGAISHVFIVDNLHSESHPSNAVISLRGAKQGGVIRISAVFLQTASTLVDARELAVSRITLQEIPYTAPLDVAFKLNPQSPMAWNGNWRFVDWPGDAENPSWWSNRTVPRKIVQYR